MRVFSFGGGVQSVACLVLAAQGRIDYKTFIFANTGDDSENPETLHYLDNVAMPFAIKHGLDLRIRAKTKRDGTVETLFQNLVSENNRTIAIPVRLSTGAFGTRKCTADWKIQVVSNEVRSMFGTRANKKTPATVAIGISMDESLRAKDSLKQYIQHDFPLLNLKISRLECGNIIRGAGLPLPPKSSCWFCPYKRIQEWREMAANDPDRFALACELEAKRGVLGKDRVYLTGALRPLAEAILPNDQLKLPLLEECSGYCWS